MNDQGTKNLYDMVNIQAFLEIGIKKEDTEPILLGIFALLREEIDQEISRILTHEDEELVKNTFDPNDHIKIALAYNELYSQKTGNSLEEFSQKRLNELIKHTAAFLKAQRAFAEKAAGFDEIQASKFIELVDQEKFDEAEEMLKGK